MSDTQVFPPAYAVTVERDVPIPMRDGTILRADIYRPAAEGRFPVLVERVCYELVSRCAGNGDYYARRGYVVVGQNVRGTFASAGRFDPLRDDGWGMRRDGYDTIEWAGAQPWADGKVGMLDGSYSGSTQYAVAPTRPPHLTALFVREGGADLYRDFVFRGGAYQMFHRRWAITTMLAQLRHATAPAGSAPARDLLEAANSDFATAARRLPLRDFPPLAGVADWYGEHLARPEDGPFWQPANALRQVEEIETPMLHFGAWFDLFLDSTLKMFQGVQARGRSAACRRAQRLLIGPWIHGPQNAGQRRVGDLDFGPAAELDFQHERLRWYDHWLKGRPNGVMDGPAARVFLMGANRWLDLETWPPAGVAYRPFYLRAGTGGDATSLNHGRLTPDAPAGAEPADRFTYDPADPIPSLFSGLELGPRDFRALEGRMLTFTSDVLARDLTVIGPVRAVLYVASSAPDTDWVARLCDVWPDGRSMSVCDGIQRARYRHGLERAELTIPGQVYSVEIDMQATAQVFQAGHRLRVEVTSSDFPQYDRNLNTGGPFGEEAAGQIAVNEVWHDAARPARIVLPVLENQTEDHRIAHV